MIETLGDSRDGILGGVPGAAALLVRVTLALARCVALVAREQRRRVALGLWGLGEAWEEWCGGKPG